MASRDVSLPDIVEFVRHPDFLGLSLSEPQEALLRAIYGLPLVNDEQVDAYHACTGRQAPYEPGHPFDEVTVIAGRRAGKDSRIACPIAVYEATFGQHDLVLAEPAHKGERGIVALVAQDARGTEVAFRYIHAYFVESPCLRRILAEEYKYELRLANRLSIAAFACTAKSLRGWSIPCAVMDEVAFFRSESGATVDFEIQKSLIPGGVSFKQQRLIKISTPHVKAGVIWKDFESYYAKDTPDVLVWQASTALMNPTVDQKKLAREARVDPHRYTQEYEALFADVTTGAIPGPWIDAAVIEDRPALPPLAQYTYTAAVDPSGGANDEFVLTVIHVDEEGHFVQDLIRGWPGSRQGKVDLAAIVSEIADLIRPYFLARVIGDQYAGEWVGQEFRKVNVLYERFGAAKSVAYKEVIPFFAQLRVKLLDDIVQTRQLRLLEKTERIGGKPPVIDHPKGGSDDRANALAYAIAHRARSLSPAFDVGVTEVGQAAPTAAPSTPDTVEGLRRLWSDRGPASSFWGRARDQGETRRRLFGGVW